MVWENKAKNLILNFYNFHALNMLGLFIFDLECLLNLISNKIHRFMDLKTKINYSKLYYLHQSHLGF